MLTHAAKCHVRSDHLHYHPEEAEEESEQDIALHQKAEQPKGLLRRSGGGGAMEAVCGATGAVLAALLLVGLCSTCAGGKPSPRCACAANGIARMGDAH